MSTNPVPSIDTPRRRGRPFKPDLTASSNLQFGLAEFDSLPDSAHVRLPVVKGLYGCSASAVWRNVKIGVIPPPKKLLANLSAWNVGELREALGLQRTNS